MPKVKDPMTTGILTKGAGNGTKSKASTLEQGGGHLSIGQRAMRPLTF